MTYIPHRDPFVEISRNNVAGQRIMRGLGERESIGTTVQGEDLWRGTATEIPRPADAGVQMEVVSSNANDTSAGTGVQTLRVEYLDASGDEQTEDITMNGTTPVVLTETNVRYVNDMYALTTGSNGVAEGDIDIYLQGASSTIYNMIAMGGNKSLVPHRMVPNGKTLYLRKWMCGEGNNKRLTIRLRADCNNDVPPARQAGTFLFKSCIYVNQSTSGPMDLAYAIPELCVVRVTAWASAVNGEASVHWWGVLIDD